MYNTILTRKIALIAGIVAAIIGLVLYLGSYFWGAWLLLAGALLYLFYRTEDNLAETTKRVIMPFLRTMAIPVVGIFAALIVGALIMLITGYNPVRAYSALFYGGLVKNWSVTILNATPLIFTGLAISLAFKAGLFNIGAEGQYYIGTMAAAVLGIYLNMPGIIAIPLIYLIGGGLSAAYNFVPAFLKVRTGAHEVITTMMFAHIARLLSPIVIRSFGSDLAKTDEIFGQLWLPNLQDLLPQASSRLHIGILIAIGTALLVHYLIKHTQIGFEIRAVGHNRYAARAQGIPVGRVIIRALMLSGLLAGMAGITQVLGLTHKMFEDLNAGYGWNGISVALLASNNPIAVIFTALLWGALDAGGQYMQRNAGTPHSVVEIIKGIILFLIVARYVYQHFGARLKHRWLNRKSAAVAATALHS